MGTGNAAHIDIHEDEVDDCLVGNKHMVCLLTIPTHKDLMTHLGQSSLQNLHIDSVVICDDDGEARCRRRSRLHG